MPSEDCLVRPGKRAHGPKLVGRLPVGVLSAFALSGVLVPAAAVTPAGDLQTQAAQLNAQIHATGAKVAALGEQLDAAQPKLETVEEQTKQLETVVRERAAVIYRSVGANATLDFSTTNVQDFSVRSKYTSILDAHDLQLIDQLESSAGPPAGDARRAAWLALHRSTPTDSGGLGG